MKRAVLALGLVLALGYVASAQDTTTLLSQFLVDLRNGTWGVTNVVTGLTVTKDAIALTPTTALTLRNTTDATGGTTVQMSPRQLWRGTAWDTAASETVDFFAENLPATAATPTGTWKLGYSLNGAAVTYPLTVTSAGVVNALSTIQSGFSLQMAATGNLIWAGRSLITAPSNGATNQTINAGTSGIQQTYGGDVTVTTCGTGSVTTKSKNTAGEITATGATACTVVFHTTPTFTNKPFCTATAESGTQPTIVVNTTVSFTVTGLTSGAAFMYHCDGPI